MASSHLSKVLDRTLRDEEFLDRFRTDPDDALDEYDLSDEERDALVSGEVTDYNAQGEGMQSVSPCVCVVIIIISD